MMEVLNYFLNVNENILWTSNTILISETREDPPGSRVGKNGENGKKYKKMPSVCGKLF